MELSTVLFKLFRLKPVFAWAICGILLGISVAISENGFLLNWLSIGIAVLPIILLQAFIAHAINDLADEEVDKITDLKGTNRFKVLVSGIASRKDLALLISFFIGIASIAAVILTVEFGNIILLFYAVGLYAAIGYSFSPLKLGWKPFAEWTVVFPVLVTLVVAVNYIATGNLSYLALQIGILFALFNIIWFLVSRMVDYTPDRLCGKITTFVKLGLSYKPSFIEARCADGIHYYLAFVYILLFWYIVYIGIFISNSIFLVSIISCLFIVNRLPRYYSYAPSILSEIRADLIYITIFNNIVISVILIINGIYQ